MQEPDDIPAYLSLLKHASSEMRYRTIMLGIGYIYPDPGLECEAKSAFVFGAWKDEQPATDFYPYVVRSADFSLVLFCPDLASDLASSEFLSLASAALTEFPMQYATTLSICYHLSVVLYPFEIYSVMREVETLHMMGGEEEVDPVDDLIRILQEPKRFFPKLRVVVLEWLDFNHRYTEFKHALAARQQSSLPIEELVVRNVDRLQPSDFNELNAMVQIHWDEDGTVMV